MNPKENHILKSFLAKRKPRQYLATYYKVLARLLNDNCTSYDWCGAVLGYIRGRNPRGLYEWAESATTAVYGSAAEHYAANQLCALILKYPWDWSEIGLLKSPEETAVDKFWAAEQRCAKTNRRFKHRYRCASGAYAPYLGFMRKWILHVIGEKPDLPSIYSKCNFSGGASIGVHGNATNLFRKLYQEGGWSCSPTAAPYAISALLSNEQFLQAFCPGDKGYIWPDVSHAVSSLSSAFRQTVVKFNKVGFVPKTAKTHRAIAVEPTLNSFIQKGADAVLREKLAEVGIDLSDQGRNRALARIGSKDGSLATVDLSSASDTVATNLCRFLLPEAWFEFLDAIRSPNFVLDGDDVSHPYEKFASMGNGFCFPLETLVFAAAARAAIHFTGAPRTYGVYGDDIIVPVEAYETLRRILLYCGFVLNRDKTFKTGPFRESCGADWYEGQDVRPVYLKDHLYDVSRIATFHNATLRSERVAAFFEGARSELRNTVPEQQRLVRPPIRRASPVLMLLLNDLNLADEIAEYIPVDDDTFVDGAFTVPWDIFMGSRFAKWNRDEQRWSWKEAVFKPRLDRLPVGHSSEVAKYLAFLSGNNEGKLSLRYSTRPRLITR